MAARSGRSGPDRSAAAAAARTSQALTESPAACGGGLDPRPELLRHAEVDPRHRALPGVGRVDRGRGLCREGPACTSAGGADTTNSGSRPRRRSSTDPGASSQVISSTAAARASCKRQPNGRLERRRKPLGQRLRLVAPRRACRRELPLHVLDVRVQVHVCHYGTKDVPQQIVRCHWWLSRRCTPRESW